MAAPWPDTRLQFLLYGQAAALARPEPAGEVVARLLADAASVLSRLRG